MDILREGEGPVTIVAVHGIQGTRSSWLPVVRAMAGQAAFVLPNLRGRGAALRGRGPEDYRLPCLAQDLHDAITRTVGHQPFYLAGWSLGVSVALEYLLSFDHAPQPRGLILLSGSPALCRTRLFTAFEGSALRDEIARRERRLGLAEAADHDAAAWTWQAVAGTNQRDDLPRVRIPAHIIHGTEDEDCPRLHATWLAQGIPAATLSLIDGAGHTLLGSATARVAAEMSQFVSRIERALESR